MIIMKKILSIFDLKSFPENLIPILGNYSLLLFSIGDFERAIDLTKRIAQFYETENDDEQAGITNDNIGLMLFRSGKRHDALPYASRAIEQLAKTENKSSLANAHLNFGNIIREDDPDKSIDYLKKAKTYFEKLNDPRRLSVCNRDLASSYMKMDETKNAIDCLDKALAICEQQNEKLGIAGTHLDFGITYNQMKDYPNAKKHLAQCFPIFEDHDDFVHLIEYHIQMGQVFFGERDINNAMKSYEAAFELAKKIGIKNDLIRIGIILAAGFVTGKYFKESLSYVKYVIPYIKELKNKRHISSCKDVLGVIKTELEKTR